MTTNKTNLQELAHDLDHATGGVNLATETLDDISTNFLHVIDAMDNISEESDIRVYFREWHRDLRILAKLMFHATTDLSKSNSEVHNLSNSIFEEVVKNNMASGEDLDNDN